MGELVCGDCGEVIDDAPVAVGDESWHQACALARVIGQLAAGAPVVQGLLTPRQAAEYLGESVSSVIRRKDQIGFVRLRRDGVDDDHAPVRFRMVDLERYVRANHEPARLDEHGDVVRPGRRLRPLTEQQERYPHLRPRSRR